MAISSFDIEIHLDRDDGIYYPGEEIQVYVIFDVKKKKKVNQVDGNFSTNEVFLRNRAIPTSISEMAMGKTKEITEKINSTTKIVRNAGEIPPGTRETNTITFSVPHYCSPTYNGDSGNIRHEISIYDKSSVFYKKEIIVLNPLQKWRNIKKKIISLDTWEKMEFFVRLPSNTWIEGEMIHGQLLMIPSGASIGPATISIYLACEEESDILNKEEAPIISEKKFASIVLAEKMTFQADELIVYDFILQIPILNRPTLQSKNIKVTWAINIEARKGFFPGYSTKIPLDVYSVYNRGEQLDTPSLPEDTHPELLIEKYQETNVTRRKRTVDKKNKENVVESNKRYCPQCHREDDITFSVCKECGYINKGDFVGSILISLIGIWIGVSGLNKLVNESILLWGQILKIVFCGLPGIFLIAIGILELFWLRKTRQWKENHKQEIQKLKTFIKENPVASPEEISVFMERPISWVNAMIKELMNIEQKLSIDETNAGEIN